MYLIHFKGKMDPIEVEHSEGERLKSLLSSGAGNTFVEIKGRMISLGAVKAIIPTADLKSARLADPDLRPLTPEEREQAQALMKRMRVELEEKGVLRR